VNEKGGFYMNHNLLYLSLNDIKEGSACHTHVFEIVKGLQRRNWNISLYKTNYKNSDPSILERLLEIIKVQLNLLGKLKKIDAIYIRMEFSTFPTALLGRLLGIPVIQEVNGPPEDLFIVYPISEKIASLIKCLIRKQLQWATKIIVVTSELKIWVKNEVGSKQISIIPNGANTELFKPTYSKPSYLPGKYALFFGTLAKWQGIETLMESVEYPEWPADLFLIIAGDGQEKASIIKASEYNRKIIYVGRIPYRKMPEIVAGSMMVIIPKNNLGNRSGTGLSPLKLYESLASGVPVIVTDFPGQADLVRQYKCGLVIPYDNPKALVKSVLHLYKNENTRRQMGNRGRNAIQKDHSWDKRAEQTSNLILCTLKQK